MTARDADDSGRLGELLAAVAVQQRGIELAIGEIACAAEHDEVERIDLDEFGRHEFLLLFAVWPAR